MFLKKLTLRNFKNFSDAEFDFSPKINVFVGKNGVGKTNLLDAIHYLALTKSYLNFSDVQNINFEASFFSLEGLFQRKGNEDVIFCSVQREKGKNFKKNSKTYERISEHIGNYPLVMISPYDSDLIKDGSDVRRKFMDNIISQSDPMYLQNLMRYNRVLAQRNSLLKFFFQNNQFDRPSLEIYDGEMTVLGNDIHEKRKNFTKVFLPVFNQYYQNLSRGEEEVTIRYHSHLHEHGFENLLQENLNQDRKAQYSTIGIHKDDLSFELNQYPIKKFGSQGQQKSYLVALKLAQLDWIKTYTMTTPLLLLDDIFDKLDEARVQELIRLVNEEKFGQIFISDTHVERTESIVKKINAESRIFQL